MEHLAIAAHGNDPNRVFVALHEHLCVLEVLSFRIADIQWC